MNAYNLEGIFPHPFSNEILTLDVNKIADLCYGLKDSAGVEIKKSNRGGWQSDNVNTNLIKDLEFTKLLDELRIGINKVSSNIGIVPKLDIANMWVNINKYGDYNAAHFHQGSILSGTFYVKTPENCGHIKFENPIAPLMEACLHYWHFKENELQCFPWLVSNITVPCKENMVVIFPSWLEHSVERNLNMDEDRISISFNTKTVNP